MCQVYYNSNWRVVRARNSMTKNHVKNTEAELEAIPEQKEKRQRGESDQNEYDEWGGQTRKIKAKNFRSS